MAICSTRPVGDASQEKCTFFSKDTLFYFTVITSLALAIIGAFALYGLIYPQGPFGGMGRIFGDVATYTVLGISVGTLCIAVIIRLICSYQRTRQEQAAENRDRLNS